MIVNGRARQIWRQVIVGAVLAGAGVGAAQDVSAEAPSYDLGLKVTVSTRYGSKVTLLGPETNFNPESAYLEMEWRLIAVVPSPNESQEFTLVHYLGTMPKYWNAAVYLVGRRGIVMRLSEDKVKSVSWTVDGKYILGFGDNTLRIWSTAGGRRQIGFSRDGYKIINDKIFCSVERVENQASRYYIVRRYSIPNLKLLSRIKTDKEHTCDP